MLCVETHVRVLYVVAGGLAVKICVCVTTYNVVTSLEYKLVDNEYSDMSSTAGAVERENALRFF